MAIMSQPKAVLRIYPDKPIGHTREGRPIKGRVLAWSLGKAGFVVETNATDEEGRPCWEVAIENMSVTANGDDDNRPREYILQLQ